MKKIILTLSILAMLFVGCSIDTIEKEVADIPEIPEKPVCENPEPCIITESTTQEIINFNSFNNEDGPKAVITDNNVISILGIREGHEGNQATIFDLSNYSNLSVLGNALVSTTYPIVGKNQLSLVFLETVTVLSGDFVDTEEDSISYVEFFVLNDELIYVVDLITTENNRFATNDFNIEGVKSFTIFFQGSGATDNIKFEQTITTNSCN